MDNLYQENQKVIGPFFARYPELLPLYEAYVFFGAVEEHRCNTATGERLIWTRLSCDVAPGRIAYDHTRDEMLILKGGLTANTRDALKAVAGVTAPVPDGSGQPVRRQSDGHIKTFFARYPDASPADKRPTWRRTTR